MTLQGSFYSVVASKPKDVTSFVNHISINKEHDILKGHFPGLPIVPGVCMIQIVKEQLEENLKSKIKLQSAGNIKFLSLIDPSVNTEVEVEVKYSKSDDGYYTVDGMISVNSQPYFKLVKAIYR